MAARRFPPPWTVEELTARFIGRGSLPARHYHLGSMSVSLLSSPFDQVRHRRHR
jgi:hypothetical protein